MSMSTPPMVHTTQPHLQAYIDSPQQFRWQQILNLRLNLVQITQFIPLGPLGLRFDECTRVAIHGGLFLKGFEIEFFSDARRVSIDRGGVGVLRKSAGGGGSCVGCVVELCCRWSRFFYMSLEPRFWEATGNWKGRVILPQKISWSSWLGWAQVPSGMVYMVW